MAKKKVSKKSKSFSEVVGINYIVNDKTNFVYGLILIAFAIFLIIAFISYFTTGEADQSLVTALRPENLKTRNVSFRTPAEVLAQYSHISLLHDASDCLPS